MNVPTLKTDFEKTVSVEIENSNVLMKLDGNPTETVKAKIQDYLARLEENPEASPPWIGEFWNDENADFSCRHFGKAQPKEVYRDSFYVGRLHSLPTTETIEKVLSFKPEAKGLLEAWRRVFDLSFPNWEANGLWSHLNSETSRREWAHNRIEELLTSMGDKYIERRPFSRKTEIFKEIERASMYMVDDIRDHRLHVIDNARAVTSLAKASPNCAFLQFCDLNFILAGHDQDGLPILQLMTKNYAFIRNRLSDHPEYWGWPEFEPYLGRRSIVAFSEIQFGAILADMAWQGHSHAFIKASQIKKGTWTVNLSGIKTIDDAIRKAVATIHPYTPSTAERRGCLVQEHMPFSHEQRFFVIDGKVVASVCSDRNFSYLDKTDTRLDERVAVLITPEIDQGEFDRGITTHVVDRKLAAQFARKARAIARDLKKAGRLNYVIDMGLTKRGVVAVEVNTVHLAGPYCLDHERLIKAFENKRKRFDQEIEKEVAHIISNANIPANIKNLMANLNNTDARKFFFISEAIEPIDQYQSNSLSITFTERLETKARAMLHAENLLHNSVSDA